MLFRAILCCWCIPLTAWATYVAQVQLFVSSIFLTWPQTAERLSGGREAAVFLLGAIPLLATTLN